MKIFKSYENMNEYFNYLKISLICLRSETAQQLPFSSSKDFTFGVPNSTFNYLSFIIEAHSRAKIDLKQAYSRNLASFSCLE